MGALLAETFGVEPVIRETVQERIYGELKKLLMQGRFQPGQALKIAAPALGTRPGPFVTPKKAPSVTRHSTAVGVRMATGKPSVSP